MASRILFSLVLYKHKINDFKPLLDSIESLHKVLPKNYTLELSIFDNTPKYKSNLAQKDLNLYSFDILYHLNKSNVGFGAANNRNFNYLMPKNEDILIVTNPDIEFEANSMLDMVKHFDSNIRYSCISPLIQNKEGDIQYSAKKNPTLLSLLIGFYPILKSFNFFYKYDHFHKNKQFDYRSTFIKSSYLSGCFLLIKANVYKSIKGFNETFFLHFEDADIVRRCSNQGISLHYPKTTVTHFWARGSHNSIKQIIILIISMIKYFWIWGLEFY